MADSGFWSRYPRDLSGAWHAIDDIREVLGTPGQLAGQELWRQSVERRLRDMATADEVAAKVSETIKQQRQLGLTALQKIAVSVYGLVILAATVYGAVHA